MATLAEMLGMGKQAKIAKELWDGFGNNSDNQRTVDAMKGMLGLIPGGAGDVAAGGLALDDLRRGDYTSAALNGVGILPYVPALAGMVKGSDSVAAAVTAGKGADRVVAKPKDVSVAKRFKSGGKEGIYRGTEAFGGITPQKLGQMRKNYLEKMEQGTDGRMWYDESSDDILRWTGGNTGEADTMANMLAITSAGTGVSSNLAHSNRAWNQALVGDEIKAGRFPNDMGRHMQAVVDDPAASASGLKRSPFSAGLSVAWRGQDFANRPTHDIHDVRAWGITDPKTGELWKKGVPDAGHRFLDEQGAWVTDAANSQALGGVTDWTPYRSQAAAWIAQKAKTDGVPVPEAARHYGSFGPDFQASVTREWVPGDNTGHLQELLSAPYDVREKYSTTLENIIRGRQGVDDLARQSGALVDKTVPNIGFYEGGTNPGYTSLINVGRETGQQTIDPASKRVMDAVAAAHGLLGTQKQAAWNYGSAFGDPSYAKTGAMMIPGGTIDQLPEVQRTLADLVGADNGVATMTPSGIRALNFKPEQNKALEQQLRQFGDVQKQERSSNIIPENPDKKWSAKPFLDAIDESGAMRGKIDTAIRPKAGEILSAVDKLSAEHGWQQAEWFRPMMESLRDGGLDSLRELVKKGVVPAAVLAIIGPQLAGSDNGDGAI